MTIIGDRNHVKVDALRPLWMDEAAEADNQIRHIYGDGAWLVGGAVRDTIAGVRPKDRDYVVMNRTAEEIQGAATAAGYTAQPLEVAGKLIGARVQLPVAGRWESVDVTPPRRERSTGPGHTDFDVQPISPEEQREAGEGSIGSLLEDMLRRDFTVNAIALRVSDYRPFDPTGGWDDVLGINEAFRAGNLEPTPVLRTVTGNSFIEDPLRILRGLYLVSRLGMTPDSATLRQMSENADRIHTVSPERIGDEVDKVLLGQDPARALHIGWQTGALYNAVPALGVCAGFDQRSEHHDLKLHEHLTETVRAAAGFWFLDDQRDEKLSLMWAALLHDVGKPYMAWSRDPDGPLHYYAIEKGIGFPAPTALKRFSGYSHEQAGAEVAEESLRELRRPNRIVDRVRKLVLHHMISPSGKRSRSAGRRLRAQLGDDSLIPDVFWLRAADMSAHKGGGADPEHVEALSRLLDSAVAALDEPCFPKELAITGHALVALGYEGSEIGEGLRRLTRDVIGDPSLNHPEWLEEQAKRYLKHVRREGSA